MKNSLIGKIILLVNTGSIKKRFILKRLKQMGLIIVCLNKEKNWADAYVDHWILADNANHAEAIQAIKDFKIANSHINIEGALTFWEDDVLLTSKITDRFNFTGIPFSAAKKVRNKFLFREFCLENYLPSPKHILLKSSKDIVFLPDNLQFPLVIKPAFGASSAYVIKVNNKEELVSTYDYIEQNISAKTESALADGMDIFVEEYIDGDEVDVDIILQNGKTKFFSISDNFQTKEPFFVETGQAIPSSLPAKSQSDLLEMAEETLEKLGIQNGIIHFEAKSTPAGPVPIEINLRMGGDYVYSYIKGSWGIDLIENAVKIALGEHLKIQKPAEPIKYIIGQDFRSDNSGVLVKLNIKDEVKRLSFVEEMHFYKKIGDPILVPPEGYDNLGWITVSGYSLLDAQDNLQKASNFVNFEIAKFTANSSIGKTSRKNSFSEALLNVDLLLQAAKIEKIRRITKEDQRKLYIGIAANVNKDVHNGHLPIEKNIEKALRERGYRTTVFDLNNIEKAFLKMRASEVDLIFNVGEKIHNSNILASYAPSIFDILQIPYTGSSSLVLGLSMDKIQVKKLLSYHGIPTSKWDYIHEINEEIDNTLRYPQIVKPANTDRSFGITNESVVNNQEERFKQLKKIIEEMGSPALIEEYIEGDEYDVAVLGNKDIDLRVLPLSRYIFKDMPSDLRHIFTYNMKNFDVSLADFGIVVQRPAKNISKKLETLITEIALDTYNILNCYDYGLVGIRVDQDDNPYVLELNANPSINIQDCLAETAKLTQINYGDFLEEVIRMAVRRYQNKPLDYRLQLSQSQDNANEPK